MKILNNSVKKLKNLVRKEVCVLRLRILSFVSVFVTKNARQTSLLSLSQGCTSSKYAPDFYTVMPKENSAPECKKTDAKCSEKTKMTVTPVDASTPLSNGKLQFIQTFWVNLPMSLISPVLL